MDFCAKVIDCFIVELLVDGVLYSPGFVVKVWEMVVCREQERVVQNIFKVVLLVYFFFKLEDLGVKNFSFPFS